MKQLFTLFFLFQTLYLFGQLTVPCPSNATIPADIMSDACIYCNFNGIQSSTAGFTADTIPGYCGTLENGQFLGFIAGESGITFNLLTTNCQNGDGLDAAIISGTTQQIISCNAGQSGGGTAPFAISASNLVMGQNYYLFVDGYAGDVCDFTITASPPSALTPPIPNAPQSISGPSQICPNAVVEYSIPPIPDASAYTWVAPPDALINGMPPPVTIAGQNLGNTVTITFASSSGVICVNGANSCFTGPPMCQPIVVAPIPPTQLPDTVICQQNLPYTGFFGKTIYSTGVYDTILQSQYGCDSLVRQFVYIKIPIPCLKPPIPLCEGDSLLVCGTAYYNQGNYTALCIGSDGCDSVINFTIIIPDLEAEITGATTSCGGFPQTISYGQSVGTPTWYELNNPVPISTDPNCTIPELGSYVLGLEFIVGMKTCSAYDTIVFDCPFLPTPCPSNTALPADNCADACIYCDFNGLQSSTAGYTSDTLSPNFILENGQFLGFIAGETSATFTAIPSNCQNGDGIEVGIISNCDDTPLGSLGGGMIPATISVNNMIVGENYFFFIDGKNGDECDFTVVASPPSAVEAPLPSAPTNMIGRTKVCPNSINVYSTPPIQGATAYTWTAPLGALINGNPSPYTALAANMGNIVAVEFADTPGDVCVNGVNSCNGGQTLCKEVRFEEFLTLTGDTVICEGEPIPSPFDTTYVTADGCDSVVQFVTILMASAPTVLPSVNLCESDSLLICDTYYTQAGTFTDTCSSANGCDSLITFTINIPQFAEIVQGDSVECPMLPYTLTYVPGPGVPTWRKLGSTTPLSNNLSVDVTEYGTYIFELEYLIASEFCTEGDTIVLYCTSPTSEATVFEQAVQVRPSIGNGLFTISIFGEKGMSALRVLDMQGRLLQHEQIQDAGSYVLDASTLQSGTYVVSVLIDGQWVQKRIVKI